MYLIILYLITFIFFFNKSVELWFSSVIRRKPYIFGANQNRNRLNLSVAKYITHWFQRKLTAPIRPMVKQLNKPFGRPDRFPALAKGQSKLAFLNRNLKGCPKKLRDTAYISLIRPALEYSCSVWHPHKKVTKTKLKKFSAEQPDLFRTILGVKQVPQKCYTT